MSDADVRLVPAEPLMVLQRFVEAGTRGDVEGMKTCLSAGTLASGQFNGDQPKRVRFTFGEAAWEGDKVVIPMTGTPEDPAAAGMPAMQMQCIMIQEEGAWKFDLNATMERMFGGSMEAVVDQLAEGMKTAMEGIGQALGEAMGGVFGELEPTDWSGASLVPAEEELYPMPEFVAMPKLTARVTEALGFPVNARADMKGLLGGLGSTEHDKLMEWMEDQLFAAWGQLLAEANGIVPLAGRLRDIRIEAAQNSDNRVLIVDGNDLVYRVYFNANEGFFSDAEIQARLAGVLAGLPAELEEATANARTVANDEETPHVDMYRELAVPRWMRRISDLIGRQVALKVDWSRADDPWRAGKQLPRWMMNRIYGALALACADEGLRAELTANLKGVAVDFVFSPDYKYAKYEEGVFTVGIWWWEGERGVWYEYELVPALRGEKVGQEWVEEPMTDVSEEAMASADAGENTLEMASAPAAINPMYETAHQLAFKLDDTLKETGLWPGEPPEEPMEIKGAFGCENMTFPQWLSWFLVPRIHEIAAEQGSFPTQSDVATYARRELDGAPGGEQVISVLQEIDDFINAGSQ